MREECDNNVSVKEVVKAQTANVVKYGAFGRIMQQEV
jgi:hypothetical protein